jgi:hypothetical protein
MEVALKQTLILNQTILMIMELLKLLLVLLGVFLAMLQRIILHVLHYNQDMLKIQMEILLLAILNVKAAFQVILLIAHNAMAKVHS